LPAKVEHNTTLTSLIAVMAVHWWCVFPVYADSAQEIIVESNSVEIMSYQWLQKTKKIWRLCSCYPHLKDAYWLSVNYGMASQANAMNAALKVMDAGGYDEIERQRMQIQACLNWGADAIILGAVSFNGLSEMIESVSRAVPVVATVNDVNDQGISAKTGVNWYQMGYKTGTFLAKRHPTGTATQKIALLLGSETAGWSQITQQGFLEAIRNTALEVSIAKWGDTGRDKQLTLVEDVLEEAPDINYIVGSAVAAEVAVSELRLRNLNDNIQIISLYFSPGVYRGIKRNRILAAPTDSPILQGRLSVDQALRILEKKPYLKEIGPKIIMLHSGNIETFDSQHSLTPPMFQPVYQLDPQVVEGKLQIP